MTSKNSNEVTITSRPVGGALNSVTRGRGLPSSVLLASAIFLGFSLTFVKVAVGSALLLLLSRRKVLKCLDTNLILLMALLGSYLLGTTHNGYLKTSPSLSLLFLPPLAYATGRWMGRHLTSSESLARSMVFVGICLAAAPTFGVLLTIQEYGFAGGGRTIENLGAEASDGLNATVIGGNFVVLMSIAGVIFTRTSDLRFWERLLIILLVAISVLVALRIGSRTQLGIVIGSAVLGLMINLRRLNIAGLILGGLLVATAAYFLSQDNLYAIDAFSYLADRAGTSEFGTSTVGGRTERWAGALALMVSNPFGWSFHLQGYAHNLWLDIARNGGWMSFFFAIICSGAFAKTSISSIAARRDDRLFTTVTSCLTFGFIALFLVEPIFDGFIYPFSAFCTFWGTLAALPRTRAK